MIPRTAFSETRVRSAALTLRYPYPPLEAGKRLRHLRPEPGVSVNGEPDVAAVGGCLARWGCGRFLGDRTERFSYVRS